MDAPSSARPTRVMHVASRLAIGGPALHAITLTDRLRGLGYEVILVRGREEPREGTLDELARVHHVEATTVPSIRRSPQPRDLWAIFELWRLIRRVRPDVLHTHMAKAGAIGRIAALLAGRRRPRVIIHTFHGHVFRGYFRPGVARAFVLAERVLARLATRLLAVSEEVRADLAAYKIAPPDQIETIHLGVDLQDFEISPEERERQRATLRTELGIAADALVVTIAARLVPVKRIDRFLRVAAALEGEPGVRFVIAGGGELQESLPQSAEARAVADRVIWLGFRQDIASIYRASDVVVLTSSTEGTPTSLIEAAACGLPVVATDVGGVRTVVEHDKTGFIVPEDDEQAFAARLVALLRDPELRVRTGAAARERAQREFAIERMVKEVDDLYKRLLRT